MNAKVGHDWAWLSHQSSDHRLWVTAPEAEVKGYRPRALEPLALTSGLPARVGPRGNLALTGPSAPPCPDWTLAHRCRRRRLPKAPARGF